jgi:basic amino acid/polyamine antiporter, APA family
MPRVSTLQRRLGVHDAVVIGLGSMIGAGIFVALPRWPR